LTRHEQDRADVFGRVLKKGFQLRGTGIRDFLVKIYLKIGNFANSAAFAEKKRVVDLPEVVEKVVFEKGVVVLKVFVEIFQVQKRNEVLAGALRSLFAVKRDFCFWRSVQSLRFQNALFFLENILLISFLLRVVEKKVGSPNSAGDRVLDVFFARSIEIDVSEKLFLRLRKKRSPRAFVAN
jgi:hypothetical protein